MSKKLFIVKRTSKGIKLVQLHAHKSLTEKEGHTEVTMNAGDIFNLDYLGLVNMALTPVNAVTPQEEEEHD
jgi:hypothetical protein